MDEQRAPQQPQGQVQIKADEKELQGEYSNLVMVHHNLEEFTLNFIYIFPNGAQGKKPVFVYERPTLPDRKPKLPANWPGRQDKKPKQ